MPTIVFPPSSLPVDPQPTPSLTAFAEAQNRLRMQFGVDATFLLTPFQATYPSGTPLDPETGKPYDPFLEPAVPALAQEIILRCSFVHRPFTPGQWGGLDTPGTPIGNVDRGIAGLIVAYEDYPLVKDASRVRVGPETWDIEFWRYDVLAGHERWLVYLEHA